MKNESISGYLALSNGKPIEAGLAFFPAEHTLPALMKNDSLRSAVFSRRDFFSTAAVGATAAALSGSKSSAAVTPSDVPGADYRITNGNIRHSVMGWCFNPMPMNELMDACNAMGMTAMEGINSSFYPRLRKLGMNPSLVGSHGFKDGPTSTDKHAHCIEKLRNGIDLAVEYGAPGVITFTGMRVDGLTDKQMTQNCLDCWREVIDYAEEKNVNICLEHLNSRDNTHPMKGHPGYYGDDVDFCIELVRKMDSERFKLLFDIYHVQIMNGDVIRRLRQYIKYIGHVHTAGVPGRGELTEDQEVNYPAIMRELLRVNYQGYVAHEFIPTWDDPLASLRHGVRVCDV